MVKGEVGGAVTPPRYLFAIESVLPIPEIGSLTSVDGRCTPRVAALPSTPMHPAQTSRPRDAASLPTTTSVGATFLPPLPLAHPLPPPTSTIVSTISPWTRSPCHTKRSFPNPPRSVHAVLTGGSRSSRATSHLCDRQRVVCKGVVASSRPTGQPEKLAAPERSGSYQSRFRLQCQRDPASRIKLGNVRATNRYSAFTSGASSTSSREPTFRASNTSMITQLGR